MGLRLFLFIPFLLIGFNSFCQDYKSELITFDDDRCLTLEYPMEVMPLWIKSLSENKHSYVERLDDRLYIFSLTDDRVDGQYVSKLHVRCTDLEGNSKWIKQIGDFSKTSILDLLPLSDGVCILYDGYTGRFNRSSFLSKLDDKGEELWTLDLGKYYGTESLDIMKTDSEGNIYFVLRNNSTSFLVKVSPDGDLLLKKGYTEKSELSFMDFDFDDEGNVYLIGQIVSYPNKKMDMESFLYKLDPNFELIGKKNDLFGNKTIANSLKYIGNGKLAFKVSSDINYNKPSGERVHHLYGLVDLDLNISNITEIISSSATNRNRFKYIGDNMIIAFEELYINKTSYKAFYVFDINMKYQKSILVDFHTGIMDAVLLDNKEVIVSRFSEELIKIKLDF